MGNPLWCRVSDMRESNAKNGQGDDCAHDEAGPAKGARASFVMTVWVEPHEGTEEDLEWRWRVRHVQTGQESYFRRYADVLRFIGQQSDLSPPQ